MMPDKFPLYNDEKILESYGYAKRNGVLIFEIQQDCIYLVYRSDCNPDAIIEFRRHMKLRIHLEEVSIEKFTHMLTQKYETKAMGSNKVAEKMEEDVDLKQLLKHLPVAKDLLESENDAPVIRLINALFREAIEKSASDIHLETYEEKLSVRLRIDGMLHKTLEVPNFLSPLIISRIKIMAKLDISEKRLPQDGRITVNIAGRSVDVRVSTIPVSHGERVVLRLLDKRSVHLNLMDLGLSDVLLSVLRRMIAKPHGIMVITGPTGSGKTTTLYAVLTELNDFIRNIMTVEDPVEYDLLGISQTQVNPKIDMTFAKTLRAILRQDPDVVMVGEIRDLETGVIAIQASLTGHLVFSTLHTQTAIGAIARLRDMGVESFLLASSLLGIVAQRLVRLLCSECKQAVLPTIVQCQLLGISADGDIKIYQPVGCDQCGHTGFRRRIAIYEIVEVDSTLRTMIHDNKSEQELECYARKKLPSIWADACRRVLAGDTSYDEIIRVTTE
jgi:general secretion pathway protein E